MFFNPSPDYQALMKSHHRVRVEVYIMDVSRRIISDATNNLITGVVDMDATASVTRSGSVELLDPFGSLGLDYSDTSLYNRLIHIVYAIAPLSGGVYSRAPIFTGPISSVIKEGPVAKVEFKGTEVLAQAGMLNPYTWPAGWSRAGVIMNALAIVTGELYFNDQTGGRMPLGSNWSVDQGESLWVRLQELADGMACRLYYDGNGVCQIVPKTTAPVFTFDSTWLTSQPQQSFDVDKLNNVVRVEGATVAISPDPEVDKVKMAFEAWPPASHPFSPQSLARNGRIRVLPHHISDDSLAAWVDIVWTAWNNLDWDLALTAEATATSAVMPLLEENDMVNFNHPKLYGTFALTKWTIPLVGDAEMSMNFFSSTSRGSTRGTPVTNAGNWGRMNQPGVKHGPSGGFNTLVDQGSRNSGTHKGGKKKNKKKGKDKGKGKK